MVTSPLRRIVALLPVIVTRLVLPLSNFTAGPEFALACSLNVLLRSKPNLLAQPESDLLLGFVHRERAFPVGRREDLRPRVGRHDPGPPRPDDGRHIAGNRHNLAVAADKTQRLVALG
jgi:hypothetical protein